MNNVIQLRRHQYLCGARLWAHWHGLGTIPQYHLYEYSGSNPATGMHFFIGYRNPTRIITRSTSQLQVPGNFRPFAIDTREFFKYINSILQGPGA